MFSVVFVFMVINCGYEQKGCVYGYKHKVQTATGTDIRTKICIDQSKVTLNPLSSKTRKCTMENIIPN